MFVWKVRSLKAESGGCSQPSMTVLGDRPGVGIARQERVTARVWSQLPEITIDHGIMEHANGSRWCGRPRLVDVGDWSGLGELIEQDALGNSVRGEL